MLNNRTAEAVKIVDKLLNENDKMDRQTILSIVEAELGLSGLANVVGSILYSGAKEGKYLKISRGVYSLNKDYDKVKTTPDKCYINNLRKVSSVIDKDLKSLSVELLDAHIGGNLANDKLSEYKKLKHIYDILNGCIAYVVDDDITTLKGVLNSIN